MAHHPLRFAQARPGQPSISALAVVPVDCRFEQMALNQRLRAFSHVATLDIIASYPRSFPPDISATARIASFPASARVTSAMATPLFAVEVALWALAQPVLRRPPYDIVYTDRDLSVVAGWLLRANRAVLSFLLRRVATVITIGLDHVDRLPQLLIRGYQVRADRIVPLRQSVDIRRIQDVARVPSPVSSPEWPVLSFVGYVSKLRGVYVLLRAAGILRERGRFLEVALVGHLKGQDKQWFAAAKAMHPRIWYHRVLPAYEALRRMSATTIDVLPFPYLRASAPVQAIARVEDLALGEPIVATELLGTRALVDQMVNGILVPPHDPAAMADAIEVILGTPGLSEQMGRVALKKQSLSTRCISGRR